MNKAALDHSLSYIDSWLAYRYKRDHVPGFVVAIAHKGELVFNQAYGYADLQTKTKMGSESIFRIASHSKTFTATAIMLLAEQGKLHIDDYAADYLPWLKAHSDKRWAKVTIRQLMSHGAGVIRDGQDDDFWQLERPFPDVRTLRQAVLNTKLVLDNNVKMKYSNYGYALLGQVIEAISKTSYNNFVTKHIVKVLNLKDTGPEYTSAIKKRLVTGYSREEYDHVRLPIAPIDSRVLSPATGFYSTAADLCKYFSAQMVGSGKLLADESKKEMQKVQWHVNRPGNPNYQDYGLGLEIEQLGKHRVFGHGGGFPGHITKSWADPKDQLVVVVLANYLDSTASWTARAIYGIIDYFQNNLPSARPKHDLSALEGRYVNLWAVADFVVTGDRVVTTSPDSWEPLKEVEDLEYVDNNTLKINDTDSFDTEGELITFKTRNTKVTSLRYAGSSMWPEADWVKKQRSRRTMQP